ncbi:MAG: transporter substrate-binding domain-containing protein [Rhodospirillaceae bacterium]|mgnify:FL=1|nr:transporter substrate-binding domain-containing protein [Rhodospirillaceae bacterium]MBT6118557.1 transporter substrate-binding domain-containing protein [Rhodospirillaceae bacterium]
MKLRHILSAVLAATIGLSAGTALADDHEGDSLIQEITERGVLRACHAEALPWGIKDPKTGEWVGSDVEAANHLAETMGVKAEHVDTAWATLIPSLETGKCDIVMAPMFATPERAMKVLFADPAGFESMSIAVSADSGITSYADLDVDGKSVAVISGTADESFSNRYFKKAEVKPSVTDKLATVFLEVASKRADAVLTDTSTLHRMVKENAPMKLMVLGGDPLNPQGYSYAVRPGEYHFINFVNIWQKFIAREGLKEMWHNKFTQE